MRTAERHNIQELFMNGEIDVVCCTNAFGMGVDKQNIRFVIHYDHPSSVEAYAQETGRAGRDGQDAYAILLYSSTTQRTHRMIARKSLQDSGKAYELLEVLTELQTTSHSENGEIITSFEDLSKTLKVEEVVMRVLLHGAEQVGLLQRGLDVVMEAGILLTGDVATLITRLQDAQAQDMAIKLFEHLLAKKYPQNEPMIQQSEATCIRLNYNARDWMAAGGDAFEVTTLLNQLSELEPERCIFRPYTRGITLRLHSQSLSEREATSHQLSTYYYARYECFEERLQAILDYIYQPQRQCRRAFIENYLSGRKDITACGMCDHCAPNYTVAWNEQLVEANIHRQSPAQQMYQLDVAMIILESLRDHSGSFSQNTFIKMLLGEGFGQSRDGTKYTLNPAARNSEHFGELKHQRVKEKHIRDTMQHLVERGYIALEMRIRGGSDAPTISGQDKYIVLTLTSLGKDVLAGESNLHVAQV